MLLTVGHAPERVGRADEVDIPALVSWGDRDVPDVITRSSELAARLPKGDHRVLAGLAHLPYLEQPAAVAGLIAGSSRHAEKTPAGMRLAGRHVFWLSRAA